MGSSESGDMVKTVQGIPAPGFPKGVVLADEARKSRRRLYPVTVLYVTGSVAVLARAFQAPHRATAAVYALAGLVLWTYYEYLFHRYILHGIFPPGRGLVANLLHKAFDHLHWRHHLRPWDGNHINGTIFDTIPLVALFGGLAALAPLHTAPALVAALVLGYVAEEWAHHCVHFYSFRNRYFRYLKARHFYHHSPRGAEVSFGLSSNLWDLVCGTLPTEQAVEDARRAGSPEAGEWVLGRLPTTEEAARFS